LKLEQGERVALVGESGSGKSITALASLALVPPPGKITSGAVRAGAHDLLAAPPEVLNSIRGGVVGMVFQEAGSAFNPVYTIGFQLTETARHHCRLSRTEARSVARSTLADLGFSNPEAIAAAYPHQLSGGQAQRAMLAAALIGNPRFLIADEPTTALDPTTQALVLGLLNRLVEERNLGLLYICHDLTLVHGIVDRVLVMYAGEIVEAGTTSQVLESPLHPYSRLLVSAARSTNVHQPNDAPVAPAEGEDCCRFLPRCDRWADSCATARPALARTEDARLCRCPIVIAEK
jgi:oligopeptide/dipeptide ABC transporter ATP-binding protein